tara:strand:+ start:2810 stop:4576 length:1767 start_codon:yes stop_codon:yes gene_type:complete
MANFTSNKVNKTYQRLVQVDNALIQDGLGKLISGSIGALKVTGSLSVTGSLGIDGYTNVTTAIQRLDQFSASLDATFATDAQLSNVSQSLAAGLAVEKGRLDNLDATYATDAQVSTAVSALNIKTGSIDSTIATANSHIQNLHSFTGSLDATYATDAQVATAVSSINSATSSYALASNIPSVTALNAATSSYATLAGGNVFTGNQTISGSGYFSINSYSEPGNSIGVQTYLDTENGTAQRYAGYTITDKNGPNAGIEITSYAISGSTQPSMQLIGGGTGSLGGTEVVLEARKDGYVRSGKRWVFNKKVNVKGTLNVTGSLLSSGSAVLTNADLTALNTFTGSLDATFATDAQVATAVSSLNSATSSYALVSNIPDVTALNAATSSHATLDGGNSFTGNQTISGSGYFSINSYAEPGNSIGVQTYLDTESGSVQRYAGYTISDKTGPNAGISINSYVISGSTQPAMQLTGGGTGSLGGTEVVLEARKDGYVRSNKRWLFNKKVNVTTTLNVTGSLLLSGSTVLTNADLTALNSATGSYALTTSLPSVSALNAATGSYALSANYISITALKDLVAAAPSYNAFTASIAAL